MLGGCVFGITCAGTIIFFTPALLDGLHRMTDGIDKLHQLAGGDTEGDNFTLALRGFKLTVDIFQIISTLSSVSMIYKSLKNALSLASEATSIGKALFGGNPEENEFLKFNAALLPFIDSLKDFGSDLQEWQDSLRARLGS